MNILNIFPLLSSIAYNLLVYILIFMLTIDYYSEESQIYGRLLNNLHFYKCSGTNSNQKEVSLTRNK